MITAAVPFRFLHRPHIFTGETANMNAGVLSTIALAVLLGQPSSSVAQVTPRRGIGAGYIQNAGQVRDQHGASNNAVRFVFQGPEANVLLRADGFSYEFITADAPTEQGASGCEVHEVMPQEPDPIGVHTHRIDIDLVGLSDQVIIRGVSPGTATLRYIDAGGVHTPRSYAQVIYENAYPNIDIVFGSVTEDDGRGARERFKYDIVVHPGGDPSLVRLHYRGAESELTAAGRITMSTIKGSFAEHIPKSFVLETGEAVEVSFKELGTATYGFDVPTLHRSGTLVIDPMPELVWSTYFGGTNSDGATSLSMAPDGGFFVGGGTHSTASIATSGAYQSTCGGMGDAFVARFSQNGDLVWATYFGGEGDEQYPVMSSDPNGRVFLGGQTSGEDLFISPNAHQPTYGGGSSDWFVAAFEPDGALAWSTFVGGIGYESVRDIDTDEQGNAVLVGYTVSSGLATPGAFDENNVSGLDGLAVKFDPDGHVSWATYVGMNYESEMALGVDCDTAGVIYITAETSSGSGLATPGTHQSLGGDELNMVLLSMNADGQRNWGTYFGGDHDDWPSDVSSDGAGRIVLVGRTQSANGIATMDAHQIAHANFTGDSDGEDGTVALFDTTGQLIWATYLGGEEHESVTTAGIDRIGAIYCVGYTHSATGIATPGAFQTTLTGTSDGFLTKFSPDGLVEWSTYRGGAGLEVVLVDSTGSLLLVGSTSNPGIATSGSYQPVLAGSSDAHIDRFEQGPCSQVAVDVSSIPQVCPATGGLAIATFTHGQDPFTFEWNTSPPTLNDSLGGMNGIYLLQATDGDGCTSELPALLEGPTSASGADLGVWLIAPPLLPAGLTRLDLLVANTTCEPTSSVVTLVLDQHLDFISSIPAADLISEDTLIWSVDSLAYGSGATIVVYVVTLGDVGDSVHAEAHVSPLIGDIDQSDNHAFLDDMIVGGHDHVDKRSVPAGNGAQGFIVPEQCLTYVIRFRNPGADPVSDVLVHDTLDPALDASTFQIVASSHPMATSVLPPGNVVRFLFEDIQLPDSITDEPGSHGYVVYQACPSEGLAPGTVITNRAYVFFGTTPPLATNSVINTIEYPQSAQAEHQGGPILYPDPTDGLVRVSGLTSAPEEVVVRSVTGAVFMRTRITGEPLELDLTRLPAGLYYLTIGAVTFKVAKR